MAHINGTTESVAHLFWTITASKAIGRGAPTNRVGARLAKGVVAADWSADGVAIAAEGQRERRRTGERDRRHSHSDGRKMSARVCVTSRQFRSQ